MPFHLWSKVHLKKIVEKWGTMTEINWRTLKLFDLSKARIRIAMKDRLVLPALIEVIDGDWVFTISVAVIEDEEVRKGRAIGESTWVVLESHSGTGGGRLRDLDQRLEVVFVLGKLAERRREKKGGRLMFFQWGHVIRVVRLWGIAGLVQI